LVGKLTVAARDQSGVNNPADWAGYFRRFKYPILQALMIITVIFLQ
jgi:hypothetical protein